MDYKRTKIYVNDELVYDNHNGKVKVNKLSAKKKEEKKSNKAPKTVKGDYKLHIHGNKITLIDEDTGCIVATKCSPEDNFDIGEGMKIVFDRMNEQKKLEDSKFQVGDYVSVVNSGGTYSAYTDWVYKYLDFTNVKKYRYGYVPSEGTIGRVIAIAPHLESKCNMIVAVLTNKDFVYILNKEALQKVKQ